MGTVTCEIACIRQTKRIVLVLFSPKVVFLAETSEDIQICN